MDQQRTTQDGQEKVARPIRFGQRYELDLHEMFVLAFADLSLRIGGIARFRAAVGPGAKG